MPRMEAPSTETAPAGFEFVPLPEHFYQLQRRTTVRFEREEPSMDPKKPRELVKVRVVEGFEDIMDEPLGAGFFYNTPTSTYQLSFALSVSPHPFIAQIIKDETLTPKEIIQKCREQQVLKDFNIMDLGCGRPNFALAAKALGAEIWTADATDINPDFLKKLDGHVQIDFNKRDAAAILKNATGGEFDIVTENIIAGVPGQPFNLRRPESSTIESIGNALLKKGGYLQHSEIYLNDQMLRKK